jgi:hypothetical protein
MAHPTPHRALTHSELADVVAWRRRRLRRAGFDEPLAEVVASDWRIDIHGLLELIDRGCPPHLAARILAPLDAGEPWPR